MTASEMAPQGTSDEVNKLKCRGETASWTTAASNTEKAKPSQLAKRHEREDAEKFDLKHISCPCFLTEHEGSQEHGGLRVSHLHPDGVPSFSET